MLRTPAAKPDQIETPPTGSDAKTSRRTLGLISLWMIAPMGMRISVLGLQASLVGTIFHPGVMFGLVLGAVQDLLVSFELVLIVLLLGRIFRRARAAAVAACVVFVGFHTYLLFDFLLYRGLGIRMDLSYISFVSEAGPFFDSALDVGLGWFVAGVVVILALAVCLFPYFRRRATTVRLAPPALLAMLVTAVVAVGSMAQLPADLMYCLNNAVLEAQIEAITDLLGQSGIPQTAVCSREDAQRLVPFSQAEVAKYTDPQYPLLKHTEGFTGKKQFEVSVAEGERPHVVLLFLESFRAADIGVLGGRPGVTPEFDRLSRQGILFSNFYASGVQTTRAVVSALHGIPPRFTRGAVQSHEPDLPLIGLADLFRHRDYRTAYFHNGSLAFECKDAFFPQHGYAEVHGQYDVAARYPNAGRTSWGLHDEYLMPYVVDWLDRQDKAGRPGFATMFTVSNHHPWGTPAGHPSPDFGVSDPTYRAYLESLHYSDHCLGQFFDLLHERGLDKKTIVFVLADTSNPMGEHHANYILVHHAYEENFRIPLLIVAPGRIEHPMVVDTLGSQVDLMPTVMDLLGMSGDNHAIGTTLVREVPERIAYLENPFVRGYLALRHKDFKYIYKVSTKTSMLFDLARDPHEQNNLAKRAPEVTALYREQCLRAAQFIEQLYDQRRFAPPP